LAFVVAFSYCQAKAENRELEGACSWHQTGNCAWDGPREEDNDLGCNVDVPATVSGYCLCEDGRKEMKKGCVAGEYDTCSGACLATEKKCDDLEAWCPEIDKDVDCCSPYIQTKCPGLCNTCPAIHCEWDEWVEGECSAECGVGTKTNTRVKLVTEANGGTCDGQPTETLECKDKECPIHCEWNDWMLGECSLTCGGGMLTKTRKEKVKAQFGGEECPGPHTIEESCNVQECPVDCVWSDWTLGTCSVTCGDGVRENHRFKETEALFGGVPCEGLSVHTEACINRVCPDQCCSLNDVPDECLGLCMEEDDTSIAERSAFTSICDKYQSTVVKCTVEGGDTCTCSTPSAGTAEHNEITCTNGETTYCAEDQECYATTAFNYGQLSSACRVPTE